MISGLVMSTSGRHEQAIEELETALRLNPSFALAHTWYGLALLRAGRFDAAIEATRKARRLSPMDSFAGMYTAFHGLALLGTSRFTEALPHLRASIAAFPEFPGHYNTLISCCGHLGLLNDAQEYLAHRNRIGPPLTLSLMRHNLRAFAHCDIFVEGLAKAGVPEG
jgi:adenylate cyclase